MELDDPSIPEPDSDSRRGFLRKTGGAAAVVGIGASGSTALTAIDEDGEFAEDPFSLGITSGDPRSDSVVLWTRLVPKPLQEGGGMPAEEMTVKWELASDEGMSDVVQSGEISANPESAHSVHVELEDLESNTEYYYQFESGGKQSSVGRTKTLPSSEDEVEEFTFAFASCQQYPDGFYTAYQHMAEEDLDLIIHLGDYIYEYGINALSGVRGQQIPQEFRSEAVTLERYRLQYSLFKSDPNLRAAHAKCPWIVTWDDHEVDNNYADEVPQDPDQQPSFDLLKRRENAYQAYFEHMPLRPSRMAQGSELPLYRNFSIGDLAELNVLDARQYRSDQACNDGTAVDCEERLDESRTMLGEQQEQWLLKNLEESDATWDILANQEPMMEVDLDSGPKKKLYMDPWDGYAAARDRLFDGFVEHDVRNPIVITGDRHHNLSSNLKLNFDDQDSKTIGAEFVGTSITSGGDGEAMNEYGREILEANPHLQYYNNQRGYVRCHLTPEQWQTDYRVVPYVEEPGAPIRTDQTFVVESGAPGLQQND